MHYLWWCKGRRSVLDGNIARDAELACGLIVPHIHKEKNCPKLLA